MFAFQSTQLTNLLLSLPESKGTKNQYIMKKLILLISFAILSFSASFSQVIVDEVDINNLDLTYIKLTGVNTSVFGVKYKIYVDYGQKVKMFKAAKIKNSEGKNMKFNTMIDALNFMSKNGWKFVTYSETNVNGKIITAYLLERVSS